jgi:hypothetical protein
MLRRWLTAKDGLDWRTFVGDELACLRAGGVCAYRAKCNVSFVRLELILGLPICALNSCGEGTTARY